MKSSILQKIIFAIILCGRFFCSSYKLIPEIMANELAEVDHFNVFQFLKENFSQVKNPSIEKFKTNVQEKFKTLLNNDKLLGSIKCKDDQIVLYRLLHKECYKGNIFGSFLNALNDQNSLEFRSFKELNSKFQKMLKVFSFELLNEIYETTDQLYDYFVAFIIQNLDQYKDRFEGPSIEISIESNDEQGLPSANMNPSAASKLIPNSSPSLRGITNETGYSCYVNSSFQMLLHNDSFKKFIDEMYTNIKKKKETPLLDLIYKIHRQQFENPENNKSAPISNPKDNIKIFNKYMPSGNGETWSRQSDASEFSLKFLDSLFTEIYGLKYEQNEEAQKYFNDLFLTRTDSFGECLRCNYTDKTIEGHNAILLKVEENPLTKKVADLKDYLEIYFAGEKLPSDHFVNNNNNASFCPVNHYYRKISNLRLPKNLTISFHQVCFDIKSGNNSKHMAKIKYPVRGLKIIAPEGNQKITHVYDLCAVVYHSGVNHNKGHYNAIVIIENNWYLFNDENVSKIDKDSIDKLAEVSMLSYKKRQ